MCKLEGSQIENDIAKFENFFLHYYCRLVCIIKQGLEGFVTESMVC